MLVNSIFLCYCLFMPLRKKLLKENTYALVPLCELCGGPANYGFDVFLTMNKPGKWFCKDHKIDNPIP